MLLAGLVEGQPIRMRPLVLVDEPGGGKSRLARRLAELLSVLMQRFDGGASSDSAFGDTPRRWSTGEPSMPLLAVKRFRVANPWIQIDELEKAGRSSQNGALVDALLGFLEPASKMYPDPYVQSEVNLPWLGYIATMNDATLMPAPLRDRFRIVRLPTSRIEHLPQLARAIVGDIAAADPLGPEWTAPLDDGELAIAEDLWRGDSVRLLVRVVDTIV